MEAATLWVALVAACAAVGGSIFTFVQAKAATDTLSEAREARDESRRARDESARLAVEANTAFVRQAAAQEEANRIRRQELAPDDWTVAFDSGSRWKATNTSGVALSVRSIEVSPSHKSGLVRIRTSYGDGDYGPGKGFAFFVVKAAGGGAETITIEYRPMGATSDEWRSHVISL